MIIRFYMYMYVAMKHVSKYRFNIGTCILNVHVQCIMFNQLIMYVVDFLHEVSNDGARAQFESHLDFLIPTLVQCAKVR